MNGETCRYKTERTEIRMKTHKEIKFMRKTVKLNKIMASESEDSHDETDSIYTSFIDENEHIQQNKSIEEMSFEF